MKNIFITLLLMSTALQAHETLDHALMARGVDLENFEIVGDEVNLSGQELVKKADIVQNKQLIMSYIKADNDPEKKELILRQISQKFNDLHPDNDHPPLEPHDPHHHEEFDITQHPGGNSLSNSDRLSMNINQQHRAAHRNQIDEARAIANDQCMHQLMINNNSYAPSIAIFTGPTSLIADMTTLNNNPPSPPMPEYTLQDGLIFSCITKGSR